MSLYPPKVEAVLAITDGDSYDNWNDQMDKLRDAIESWDFVGHKRLETFERVLVHEILENPARRAARFAALVALGVVEEPRYPAPRPPKAKKTRRSVKQTENGKAARKSA